MEIRSFYYTKIMSVVIVIMTLIPFSISLLAIASGYINALTIIMAVLMIISATLLYSFLKNWLIPAFRNEPIIIIDDKTITFNGRPSILWAEIDSIYYDPGKVLGVRLKDADKFANEHPLVIKQKGFKISPDIGLSFCRISIMDKRVRCLSRHDRLFETLWRINTNVFNELFL